MIEPAMYLGIGFLLASLLTLIFIPLVHGRAVRLTIKRMEAATPISMAEIQADKDQLRAEFAMATRRLEMSVEQLKAKNTSQQVELGKKSDAVNRLKADLGEKSATIKDLEGREAALQDKLASNEKTLADTTQTLGRTERNLADKEAELARTTSELSDRTATSESQRIEIITLKTQIEALNVRIADYERDIKAAQARHEKERTELNTRLTDRDRLLAERETDNERLKIKLENARRTGFQLREEITASTTQSKETIRSLTSERDTLQQELGIAISERSKLQLELDAMKREVETVWAAEGVENSLLRERINEVAAEVVKLAVTLEGPNSPIEAILAAEAKSAEAKSTSKPANGTAQRTADNAASANLGDRMRSLQAHASRLAPQS